MIADHMGLGCKHQPYLELIHKAATTLGMTISRCIFWSQVDKVLQEGGRGEGDGKETEQRLLWDQKKQKLLWRWEETLREQKLLVLNPHENPSLTWWLPIIKLLRV